MTELHLLPVIPEMILAVLAMVMLLAGVSMKHVPIRGFSYICALLLLAVLIQFWAPSFSNSAPQEAMQQAIDAEGKIFGLSENPLFAFGDMFVVDSFARFFKILVLIAASASLVLSAGYLERNNMARFEFPVLTMLSVLGMMLMISANDLMALYVGLELQSLPLYVLAAFQRNDVRASEAGVKYFILGALSSGMLLYGASMVYGFVGSTNFNDIYTTLHTFEMSGNIGLIVGLVFMLAGLAFKISAVPFHMWTPDVYQGAPTAVTAFFAIVPKIAALALLSRLLMGAFGEIASVWQQVMIMMAGASMIIGSVGALVQNNIKRLLAYSSIGHMGYAMIGLAIGSFDGIEAMLVYLGIYAAMSIGVFAIILSMHRKDAMFDQVDDLAGMAKNHPLLALLMTILMFSMAGIPPLAGFFGKLFIFKAAIGAELYTLAIIGVLSSVVAAYYYLRVIKVMYFDDAGEKFDPIRAMGHRIVLGASVLFVLGFILYPSGLVQEAGIATNSLLKTYIAE